MQDVLIHFGGTHHKMLSTCYIVCFENLANILTNTYSVYRDVCKRHEAMFSMTAQTKDESLRAYLKQF
ncbi:hypothetical protein DVH24_018840 [Malus domestica]|uniref:Uncharacterized protein n=1 Tax=Malus domestica TaxID=3750 RepID=A0A498HPK8_MALDO|nr:hypothetical protein DVH24_018840 [Malus domestica]